MTFSGGPPCACRTAARSASSTVPITRKFSSSASTRRSSTRRECLTARVATTSGMNVTSRSGTTNVISIATAPASSSSSFISRRRSKGGRFISRIDTPEKNWKIKQSDIEERKYWNQYRKAYEDCLSGTSTREAPWYVVPADDKLSARLLVSHIILEVLDGLNMTFPEITSGRRKELQAMRKQLESE